jgi:hypothetical protein
MKALKEAIKGKMKEEGGKAISIKFPAEDEVAIFKNRQDDDLPLEIKGLAKWTIYQDFARNSYVISLGVFSASEYTVEYINNQWY